MVGLSCVTCMDASVFQLLYTLVGSYIPGDDEFIIRPHDMHAHKVKVRLFISNDIWRLDWVNGCVHT